MKRIIRLTEGDLHRIIRESVEMLLSESDEFDPSQRVEYNVTWEWEEYHRGDEGETETDGDSATETFDDEGDAFDFAEELMGTKIFFIDMRAGYGRKMCRIIVTKDVDYYYEEDGEPYTETIAMWKNENNKWVEQELQ